MPPANDIVAPAALPMQTRAALVQSFDAEKRTVDVIFTTGAPVRRIRWVGWDEAVPFDEVLEVSRDAINLDRLNGGAQALDSHNTWSSRSVVGVVEKAWLEGDKGLARIRFPEKGIDEDADRMAALVMTGIIRNVSVGYTIQKVRIEQREKIGDIEKRIVERWTPHEISFVTVPADPGAQTRSDAQLFPFIIDRALPANQENRSMPPSNEAPANETPANEVRTAATATPPAETRNTPPAPGTDPRPEPAAGADLAAERARAAEIMTLAQRHAMPAEFAPQHISAGTSLDEVRRLVLDARAARDPGASISARAEIVTDESETRAAAVGNAILHRANPQAVKLDDAARQWRGMSLLEMGRAYYEETTGKKLRGMGKIDLAGALLGLGQRGGLSTSDFPQILANVASKRLTDGYKTARQTWRPFCRQSNAPDFKERAIVQLEGMPELKKVREGGEYTRASLAESVEKYSIATYGRIIPITRQTLINDDLGAFDRMPTLFGRAAAELESDLVWGILLNNPDMHDDLPLFDTDHGNVANAGAAPSDVTVEAGEIAMGAQTDAAGKPLNLPLRYIAVSRKHKVAAQKLLTAVAQSKSSDVNVYQNSMDLIVEDRLYNAGGASPWFLIGDPAQWDTIEFAYLEGEEGLFTEERIGFDVDGIEVKGRLDFGAKALSHKAFYKNPGN